MLAGFCGAKSCVKLRPVALRAVVPFVTPTFAANVFIVSDAT